MRILLAIMLVLLSGLIAAASAAAQSAITDEADSARAGARFQLGVEMYREGNFEGALAEFRKAYEISPSYRVLYNIAQAQYALRDFVAAQQSLAEYLAGGKGELSVERRIQVDELARKLDERIGHLKISTNVAGADVRVDDVSVGTSPLSAPVAVNLGTRRVSAIKAGATAAVRVVTVAGREKVNVELQIDEPRVPPRRVGGEAASPVTTLAAKPIDVEGNDTRTALVVSLSTTAALAVGTGVLGYLALSAQGDLRDQLNTFPTTKSRIEDARSRSKTYGYLTDAAGAATLVSGGIALYLALTQDGKSTKSGARKAHESAVLVPTLGGIAFQGSF